MDGPPALTLGLESAEDSLMTKRPVKRTDDIVSLTMLIRIIFNALFMGGIMLMQSLTNFLGATYLERSNATFSLFVIMQLFNAFNARELGTTSIFKRLTKNKIMLVTFLIVFLVQVLISQCFPYVFGGESLRAILWLRIILTSSLVIIVSELAKLIVIAMRKIAQRNLSFCTYKRAKKSRIVNKN
jgi:Ca2+-transporting ATPase